MYLIPLLQGLEAGAAAVEVVLVEIIIGGVDDDEGTEDSVKVSMRASVTSSPSDVVRTFSGFMQIVYDLTTQLCSFSGQRDFLKRWIWTWRQFRETWELVALGIHAQTRKWCEARTENYHMYVPWCCARDCWYCCWCKLLTGCRSPCAKSRKCGVLPPWIICREHAEEYLLLHQPADFIVVRNDGGHVEAVAPGQGPFCTLLVRIALTTAVGAHGLEDQSAPRWLYSMQKWSKLTLSCPSWQPGLQSQSFWGPIVHWLSSFPSHCSSPQSGRYSPSVHASWHGQPWFGGCWHHPNSPPHSEHSFSW